MRLTAQVGLHLIALQQSQSLRIQVNAYLSESRIAVANVCSVCHSNPKCRSEHLERRNLHLFLTTHSILLVSLGTTPCGFQCMLCDVSWQTAQKTPKGIFDFDDDDDFFASPKPPQAKASTTVTPAPADAANISLG